MKWFWIALAVLAGVVVLVAVVGALLPTAHAAARSIRLRQSPAAVFAALTDVDAYPEWRKGLQSVTPLPARDGKRCYREVSSFGPMDILVETAEPPRRLVTRIVTEGSPFGGTWTFRLESSGAGTELTITENGEIYNVFFRALARFVFGYTGTMDGYLQSLATRFGEATKPADATPDPAPSTSH
jgi:uncharacterized protein YndB with AHSA1/START domain